MRWGLGFGLERIGLLVLRFPRIASVVVILSLVLSVLAIPRVGFDGNVVNVLNVDSPAFRNFVAHSRRFHDFSGDVSIIVRNDKMLEAETFEGLRNLHLDLTLEDGIESVFSVFTLGDASSGVAGDGGSSAPLIPDIFETDDQVKSTLASLLKDEPAAAAVIAPDENAMLILARMADQNDLSETELNERLSRMRTSVEALMPPGTTFSFSGMPPIRASVVAAIIQDQTVLTAAGILLGCLVSWLIFATVRAAILCTIPAFVAVIWVLAVFALTGTKLNFFTTALPTLALIIAFADTIVLYYRWQALNTASDASHLDNLKEAIRRVGPASSLTSITTALAFGSFAWADSLTMDLLAFFGVVSVISAFLAVIIGLPLASYWLLRFLGEPQTGRGPRFTGQGGRIAHWVTRAPATVFAVSIVCVGLFSYAHIQLPPSYALSEYLPYDSEIRQAESYADEVFGGTSQIYVMVPVTQQGTFNDRPNRDRLIAVDEIVSSIFGAERTLSLATAWKRLTEQQITAIPENLDEASPSVTGRFISDDRTALQVAASTSAGESTLVVEERVAQLRNDLRSLPFADEISITGLTVLLSEEFPKLIGDLRTGLLVSIFLAVIVVAVATQSPALALASLVPNLVPILFTESVMWVSGASLSVTNVIALTIAFGIAIDNAVHVINAFKGLQGRQLQVEQRVRAAVTEIAPALVAATAIICVAATITQLSSMPSVSELGLLLIATLVVALVSNLAILPSAMIVILRLFGDRDGSESEQT